MNAKTCGPATIGNAIQDKTLQQSPRAKSLSLVEIVTDLLVTRGLALSVSKHGKQYMAVLTSTIDRQRAAMGVADSPSESVIAVVGQYLGRGR